jgi:hypothetical protein
MNADLSKRMNPHLGVRCRQTFEIPTIPGEDMPSSRLHGLGYDEGIHCGGGAGRRQKLSGDTAMNLARLRH